VEQVEPEQRPELAQTLVVAEVAAAAGALLVAVLL
jgi:hypothetical protein